MTKILIENGRIIDPANKIDDIGSLCIADGKILQVLNPPADFTPDLTIDAKDRIVCPGFIDLSARLREPGHSHKGSIKSETKAALSAGVTSLCLPPDTKPCIDSPAVVEYIKDKAEAAEYRQIHSIGALTQRLDGTELSSMFALKQAGCIAVSNAHAPLGNLLILRRAMEYASSHGLLLMYRANEAALSGKGCAHEGAMASQYGLPGIPVAAESIALAQALELAQLTGCRIHISQISCKQSVIKIQQAKKYGLNVTADAAIHQLLLSENDVLPFDSHYHVIPPFRSEEDGHYLREGLSNGTIDAICSDHQPHDLDAKLGAFPETEPGVSALETLLPLTLELTTLHRIGLGKALASLTQNPAAILGLQAGALTPGFNADVCIFDPTLQWEVNEQSWHSAGHNTPYWRQNLIGKVTHTLQGGRLLYKFRNR
ncbi:dihydroorotase [Methylomonas methanica]|uniref:Dihydroorotase, multifunctional complex type n=1 Tax=Methylomonas methanica (strain DSM 25384 / MC09) TaxID=857087 RepID=F9ZXY7_METMM|nr:dihydroorotase [Methylomonas methanica]AEF98566.1 dihydroorotase, multifunctional complex type [Methylomonas methanica MC09]